MVKKPRREHFVNVATHYSEAVQESEAVLKYHVVYLLGNFDSSVLRCKKRKKDKKKIIIRRHVHISGAVFGSYDVSVAAVVNIGVVAC